MRKTLVLIGLLFVWMCMGFPDLALSQAQEDYTTTYTLGEVVVSAEKEVVESVGTVREITSEDIKNKGARALDEALQLLPGVYIRTGADGVPRVDLRGFRSRHVILLLDGIPLNSTYDDNFDPTLIPVESIEKIKVSYGTHSVLYGDGGLGGVVNIITKRGTKDFHGMVLGEAGDRSHYLGQFNLSGGYGKADFFLSGSHSERDGFRISNDFNTAPVEDGGTRDNSDKKRDNFFANVTFAPNDEILIGAVFNYLKGEFGKPLTTISPRDAFSESQRYERMDDVEGYSGHLSLSYDVPGPFGLRTWVFFNQLTEEENRYDDGNFESITRNGTFHHENDITIKGADLETTYDMKAAGLLTLGIRGRTEEGEFSGFDIINRRQVDIQDEKDIDIYSAALEYEITPMKGFGLVLGYGHYWLNKDEGDDNDGSYLVGAYYDIHKNTHLKGSFAKNIRFPDIRQLYDLDRGNPDLETEKSNNYELGIEQKLPWNSKVTLTGFLIDVDDYIEFVETVDPDKFVNFDKYQFTGYEVTAENRYVKNLLLRAGYT